MTRGLIYTQLTAPPAKTEYDGDKSLGQHPISGNARGDYVDPHPPPVGHFRPGIRHGWWMVGMVGWWGGGLMGGQC